MGTRGANRHISKGRDSLRCRIRHGKLARRLRRFAGAICQRSESFSKQAKSVAFSEYLEELKVFLQLIGENLVLTGPIDEDDPALAGCEEARESESLEEMQVGDTLRHDGDGRPVGQSILTKAVEIPALPVHVPILGTSTFSIPETAKRADRHAVGASRINRRRLPVVCVKFPKPFQFLAHSAKNSNWRPTLKYARTEYDAEYAPDADQFKLKLVYLTSRVSS